MKYEIVENLSNSTTYKKCLGDEDFYTSFLRFFKKEINSKGVPAVLQQYLFAEDFVADDMLVRLFMGKFSDHCTKCCPNPE